jgi:transmembrane sensor
MTTERLSYLYQQYQAGKLTVPEAREWENAIGDESTEELLLNIIDEDWNRSDLEMPEPHHDTKESIYNYVVAQPQFRSSKIVRLWPRVAIAAAVATIIFGAGLFFYKYQQKENSGAIANVSDIAPGKHGATLTLASGKKIRLADAVNGKLSEEAGVSITKTSDGKLVYEIKAENSGSDKINILSTDKGETYQLRLPDGSSVWLNAASTLKFPASFAKLKDRRVELYGEGYFEIAKDKTHPFIVKTDHQEVEVLGTHFNINAYADEPEVVTTLLEGSIKLTAGNNNKLLKPGEQAVNNDGRIDIGKANMEAITDWKNDEFFLDKMDFRAAMRKIARWYNIEVIYNGSVPDNLEAGGWIPRNSNLSDVLKSIESSGLVHFKIEGRKLYVSK